jgi:hypothetical protein
MIGGDTTIRALRVRAVSEEKGSCIFPSRKAMTSSISFASTVALLSKAAIATDAFTIVHSFNSGIITALIVCVGVMLLTQGSLFVFVRAWSFDEAYSYEDLWRMVFGRWLTGIPVFLLIIAYAMCVVAGYWEMSKYVPDLVVNVWPGAPEFVTNIWFIHYVFGALVMLPLLFSVRLADFRWLAWLSLLCVFVGMACLLAHFISQGPASLTSSHEIVLFKSDFSLITEVVDALSCAFFAHPFVAPITREMVRPTRDRVLQVTWYVNFLSAFVSYGIPLIGYLFFTDIEAEENIYAYLDGEAPEVTMGKIGVLVLSIASTIFYTFFIAQGLVQAITTAPSGSDKVPLFMAGLTVTLFSICINMMDDSWTLTLYAMGAIAFNLLGFVLPEVYYLWQFGFLNRKWGIILVVILVFGIATVVMSIYAFVTDMMEMTE